MTESTTRRRRGCPSRGRIFVCEPDARTQVQRTRPPDEEPLAPIGRERPRIGSRDRPDQVVESPSGLVPRDPTVLRATPTEGRGPRVVLRAARGGAGRQQWVRLAEERAGGLAELTVQAER